MAEFFEGIMANATRTTNNQDMLARVGFWLKLMAKIVRRRLPRGYQEIEI